MILILLTSSRKGGINVPLQSAVVAAAFFCFAMMSLVATAVSGQQPSSSPTPVLTYQPYAMTLQTTAEKLAEMDIKCDAGYNCCIETSDWNRAEVPGGGSNDQTIYKTDPQNCDLRTTSVYLEGCLRDGGKCNVRCDYNCYCTDEKGKTCTGPGGYPIKRPVGEIKVATIANDASLAPTQASTDDPYPKIFQSKTSTLSSNAQEVPGAQVGMSIICRSREKQGATPYCCIRDKTDWNRILVPGGPHHPIYTDGDPANCDLRVGGVVLQGCLAVDNRNSPKDNNNNNGSGGVSGTKTTTTCRVACHNDCTCTDENGLNCTIVNPNNEEEEEEGEGEGEEEEEETTEATSTNGNRREDDDDEQLSSSSSSSAAVTVTTAHVLFLLTYQHVFSTSVIS